MANMNENHLMVQTCHRSEAAYKPQAALLMTFCYMHIKTVVLVSLGTYMFSYHFLPLGIVRPQIPWGPEHLKMWLLGCDFII